MTTNEALERLVLRLREAGFEAAVQAGVGQWPHLDVANPDAPALNENVTVAPDNNGVWWLWSSWHEPLSRLNELDASFVRLVRILAVNPPERPA